MAIIVFLIVGIVVGFLARAITPGRDPMGVGMTMLLGIAGSFIGWAIGRAFGLYHSFQVIRPSGFFMSLIGAVILLLATRGVRRKRMAS